MRESKLFFPPLLDLPFLWLHLVMKKPQCLFSCLIFAADAFPVRLLSPVKPHMRLKRMQSKGSADTDHNGGRISGTGVYMGHPSHFVLPYYHCSV